MRKNLWNGVGVRKFRRHTVRNANQIVTGSGRWVGEVVPQGQGPHGGTEGATVVPHEKFVVVMLLVGLVVGFFDHKINTSARAGRASLIFELAADESADPSSGWTLSLKPEQSGVWKYGIGEGFRKAIMHAGFSLGGRLG